MPDPKNARLKPSSHKLAAKRFAAVRAALGGGRPELSDPNKRYPSAIERARAAYNAETGDVSLNWLADLVRAQPQDVRNWLVNMVRTAAEDPMATLAPVPTGAVRATQMTRAARLKAYRGHRTAYDKARMQNVNDFLAARRSAFESGLEPPPVRTTPRREYVVERSGPRVDVYDAMEMAPEQITLEQARAAGVLGPEQMPLPGVYRFTRRGPGVDVFER